MAHCPHCLRSLSKEEIVCQVCGSEKGYVYFYRKARGWVFLLAFGILLPMLVLLCAPFYFHDLDVYLWVVLAIALGLAVFSAYRLVIGPVWYR